jgi:ribonuclease BN (tRNA processing enzyme)
MRLTIVGSGDAFGSGGRFNTCFQVESATNRVLLDCGASSMVALRARNIEPNAIDGIILSHLHGDHFGALPFFFLDGQFLSRRERLLTIAGPPGTCERVPAALEVFFPGSSATKWRFPVEIVEIAVGVPTRLLGFDIVTTEVVHASGAPSTAVRLGAEGRVLAYSGDTEWTEALLPVADGADLFVVECYDYERALPGHLNWMTLSRRLSDLRAKRIMLTHMNPSMLAKVDEARARGLMIAEDGLVVEI